MKPCASCREQFQPISRDKFCPTCREEKSKVTCKNCGVGFLKKTWETKTFCSPRCAGQHLLNDAEYRKKFYTRERSEKIVATRMAKPGERERVRKTFIATMRKWHSEMTPEERAAHGKSISMKLKDIGHRPMIRGGNGTGPTKAEWQLLRMFPEGTLNYPVKTGKWNGSGFPPIYKVDFAIPAIKLAIEADGGSHGALKRKAADRKKAQFLEGLGWTVLRFSNAQILDFKTQVQVLADVESIISKLSQATPIP